MNAIASAFGNGLILGGIIGFGLGLIAMEWSIKKDFAEYKKWKPKQ